MDEIQDDLFEQSDNDEQITLAQYAEQAYLDYAISVVKGRALPELTDGQKPVQRRILYAMNAMGLASGAKPVKSARVVGDVLGKYHPHGDQAAYDAMVRMAQDFSLRYPLIDGQGNFGSRDGDNAAAMRYTEARLTPFAKVLLDELNQGTVEYIDNYDGSQREPVLLPARLPVMLLNGASGIAVGMATEIPSHNLNEVAAACVALIRSPKLSDEKLYELIPGPDFAGGGQIISSPEELATIYSSGRGSIKVRARWEIEELARGQWQLVVNQLPPATSSQKILEEIEEATNPKVRSGRKALTAQQQQTRTLMLGLLDAVRDESGKEDAVRLVFEPRSSRINKDEFINTLLAQTSLESNASINLVCLGLDGRPAQRSLREVLNQWLQFRSDTITKRTKFKLEKVLDRIHVLEGRMVVYLNVDEVIQTIRESDHPGPALMQRFNLTERQAEDILEMRLRQLAKLEGIKIEQELENLNQEKLDLQELLDDPKVFRRLMINELKQDAKQYGDDRRTLIEQAQRAVIEVKVVDDPVTLVVSQKWWLRTRQGHGHDASQFNFKTGDGLYDCIECRTNNDLIAIASSGRVYTVSVSGLPSARGDGQPISSMIDLQSETKINHIIAGSASEKYLLGVKSGYGFISKIKNMTSRQRAGKQFISLDDKDSLLPPLLLDEQHTHIVLISNTLRMLVVPIDQLRTLASGGKGTKLMDLEADEYISQWHAIGAEGISVSGIYRRKHTIEVLDINKLQAYVGNRARKGKLFTSKIKEFLVQACPIK